MSHWYGSIALVFFKEPFSLRMPIPFIGAPLAPVRRGTAIMPKRVVSTSRPQIVLDAHSPTPLYQQLYDRVRAAILSGQLERGMRLPSTRQLAIELGISR